jgi:carbonic anhydrase/acetyltransferase-like protein (isoleucine patch superfamily)
VIDIFDKSPTVHPTAWVAPGAVVAGAVTLGAGSSVWYTAVLRADLDTISVGANSNVQDGCILHADPGLPLSIGTSVSIGHRAVIHGCTVDDDVLIGMGAVILNRAHIGAGSIIAAGAVVLEGTEVPPGSLVAGIPGRVRRAITDPERDTIIRNAQEYAQLASAHSAAGQSSRKDTAMITPQFGDNAPSPGATSSPAMTEHVVAEAPDRGGLGTRAERRQP